MADPRFVVQRHRARRLHYDLRFEVDGVLMSWAVPKGPTLDPDVRRAAFQVDDHPLDYYDFEGVIPAGTYGGGDVIVWDAGTFAAYKTRNPRRSVERGELHVELFGTKLRGRFALVRTGDDNQWLLLHKHDEFAVKGWDAEEHPTSVLSGRTSDEVAADPDRLWRSDRPAAQAAIPLKFAEVSADELAELDGFGASGTWSVHGRAVKLTNLDNVVIPARGRAKPVTKRDLLRYAAQIGPTLGPYLTGRALRLHRRLPAHPPDWLTPGTEPKQVAGGEPAALLWATNFGLVEWRAETARLEHPNQPDCALVELDPAERTSWTDVLELARTYRAALDHLHVTGHPALVGRGVQIWVPLRRGPAADDVDDWVQRLSEAVGAVVPRLAGRITVAGDGAPLVPYSPRLAPGAPVSVPIEWGELDDPKLRPDRFTIRTVGARLAERADLFRAVLDEEQVLPKLS